MDREPKIPLNQGVDATCDRNLEMIEKSQKGLVADRQIVAKSRETIQKTKAILARNNAASAPHLPGIDLD